MSIAIALTYSNGKEVQCLEEDSAGSVSSCHLHPHRDGVL